MKLNTIASTFLLSTFLVGGMATEVEAVTLPETSTHSVTYTQVAGYNLGTWNEPIYPYMTVTATFDGYYGDLTIDDLDGYLKDRMLHEDGTYTEIDTSDVVVIAEGSTVTYHVSCDEFPEITENAFLDGRATDIHTTDVIPFDWVSGAGQNTTPSEDLKSLRVGNQVRNVYSYTQVDDATFRFFPTAGLTALTMVTAGELYDSLDGSTAVGGNLACLTFDKVLVIHQEGIDQLKETGEAHFEREYNNHVQQTRTYPGLLELFGGTTPIPQPTFSSWAEPQVTFAAENNLIVDSLGMDYTKSITRTQIATLLVNMIEQYTGTDMAQASDDTFFDSTEEAVLKAYEAGIISGTDEKRFSPSATATRQEIAIMIVNAIKVLEENTGNSFVDHSLTSLEGFSDFDTTANWAQNHVAILANNGIMTGSDGYLTPLSETSIQECLVLNNNLYQFN